MEKKNTIKPTPEQFGWYTQKGFDDESSGWMLEGGEEAYHEALKKWEDTHNPNEQKIWITYDTLSGEALAAFNTKEIAEKEAIECGCGYMGITLYNK